MPLEEETKKKSHVRSITAVLVTIFIVGIFACLFYIGEKSGIVNTSTQVVRNENAPVSTPTPFPFSELTIPFLEKQTYNGALGERTVSYNNSSYTAYVTSYTSDGLRINGLLTIPTSREPEEGYPAIIFIHGYVPPASYQTTQNYYDYVDYLAQEGFVVFKIDLRGHGNSEGEPSGAYYSSDYIVDVLNAENALANSGFVNPKRIGLWGHSMAGNVVMRSVAAKKDIPAVVIWAGAVYSYDDWQKYGIQDGSYQAPPANSQRVSRRQQLFDTYGQFNKESEFWKQVPATNFLSGVSTAVQLNHAVNDNVVDIGYSRDLRNTLQNASIQNELHEYSSGGHNITGATFNEAMKNTVSFFNKHLN